MKEGDKEKEISLVINEREKTLDVDFAMSVHERSFSNFEREG